MRWVKNISSFQCGLLLRQLDPYMAWSVSWTQRRYLVESVWTRMQRLDKQVQCTLLLHGVRCEVLFPLLMTVILNSIEPCCEKSFVLME